MDVTESYAMTRYDGGVKMVSGARMDSSREHIMQTPINPTHCHGETVVLGSYISSYSNSTMFWN